MQTLQQLYSISKDWTGAHYCGLTIKWDYPNCTVEFPFPATLSSATHLLPIPNTHAWQKPTYGDAIQYAPTPDTTPALDAKDMKHVQEVLGMLLFYARTIDSTMLPTIGTLASQQAHGTKATLEALTQLFNYCAMNPHTKAHFIASDMILHVHSNASFLSAPKAWSCFAGYHFLSHRPCNPSILPNSNEPPPPHNGTINVPCQIMHKVLSSAAEAKLAGMYYNGKEACLVHVVCLEELGHPQPAMLIQTDSSTATTGIATDTVKQKRSKVIDMHFYWIRDHVRQGQFHVFWKCGHMNKADYYMKHHPAKHHQLVQSTYLFNPADHASPNTLTVSEMTAKTFRIVVRVC
jgi:hypothetical protein